MSDIIYVDENGKPIRGIKVLRIKAKDNVMGLKDNGLALMKLCLQNKEATVAIATILVYGAAEVINTVRQLRER